MKKSVEKVQGLDQKEMLVLFEESLKTDTTKYMYIFHLKKYLDSIGPNPFFQNDTKAIEQKIIEQIISIYSVSIGLAPVEIFLRRRVPGIIGH
jgi:hypothetical protein